MDRGGETGRDQRSRQEIAIVNREADPAAIVSVKIGMRGHESLRLRQRRLGKAVDIVMAVALGMGHADESPQRQILLHGEAGLAGQVFAGYEVLYAARRAPF